MIESGTVGLAAEFAAGLVSLLSPCVLPLVPAYISYVAGQPLRVEASRLDARERLAALTLSAYFVLGFSAVFIALGAIG
jgi:cytochrome c-type biogenesis protein